MSAKSKKIISLVMALSLLWVVGLPLAGLSALAGTQNQINSSGLGSSIFPEQPARLIIPTLKIDAKIQKIGLSKTGNGSMGIPTNFTDVAWYKHGVIPGAPGSAVIAGHLNGKNVPRAVFYNLNRLRIGDLVMVVDQAGLTWSFRVTSRRLFNYNDSAADVFLGDASKQRLNLITCAGNWLKSQKLYNKRIVIFTELITIN